MKFQQLNAFKAVYELGTVTAAAESLYLTQPAVSKLVTALEHQIGFKLFERIKGRLIPTEQGKAFYVAVAKAFTALDSLAESARDIRDNHLGSLHIAAFPLLSHAYLPKLLGQYLKQEPELQGSLKSYRSEEIYRRMEIQSFDVAFADANHESPGVHSVKVACDCVCILPPESALSQQVSLTASDLVNEPFIRGEVDDIQLRIDEVFRLANIKRKDVLEVSFASSTASLVAEGIGAAIVDPFTAHQARRINPEVQVKPFNPDIAFEFTILFPALRPVSQAAKLFVTSFFEMTEQQGIVLDYDKNWLPRE